MIQNLQTAVVAGQATIQPGGHATPNAPLPAPSATAPVALPPIPDGGGRLIIDREGNRTTITTAAIPRDLLPLAGVAQETALGLMGILAGIIILGPLARMLARRLERRPEVKAAADTARLLQQQLEHLQQSVDAMSVEVERIGESQRFHTKLLHDRKG